AIVESIQKRALRIRDSPVFHDPRRYDVGWLCCVNGSSNAVGSVVVRRLCQCRSRTEPENRHQCPKAHPAKDARTHEPRYPRGALRTFIASQSIFFLKVSRPRSEPQGSTMIEQSKDLMLQAGASWVLWLLIGLSIISLGIAFDRARLFWTQRENVDSLTRDLHRLLSDGDVEAARRRLAASRSVAARVVLAGLSRWGDGRTAAEQAMAAATGLERSRMQRRLLFLGTVGNNAPFVGLLGTVIGIVGAFDALARAELVALPGARMAPERVMASIAEALVVTAIGLVVAIPAVALFNYFQGRLAASLSSAET